MINPISNESEMYYLDSLVDDDNDEIEDDNWDETPEPDFDQ